MGRPIQQIPSGTRFGEWTVIEFAGVRPNRKGGLFRVLCDCGVERIVRGQLLRNGQTRSCGHESREAFKTRWITHGHSIRNSRTYGIWNGMKQRCLNPNNPAYGDYGARGIKVCKRWRDSFVAFLQDMGEAPAGKTLDRIKNNGNYEPLNCRWATRLEQQNNTRTNFQITYRGVTRSVGDWARSVGIKKATLYCRIKNYGWPVERALTEAVNG